jgi:hypothetical protein
MPPYFFDTIPTAFRTILWGQDSVGSIGTFHKGYQGGPNLKPVPAHRGEGRNR